MSDDRSKAAVSPAEPVAFAHRLANSETFRGMFREGMALVEETASYLDGEGRRESQALSRGAALAYATESMRLTTRLMQLASWLLLQRAVNEGDLSVDQANHERDKVKLGGLSTATRGEAWEELPVQLRNLIARSLRLQDQVTRLDETLRGDPVTVAAENPIQQQMSRLAAVFGVPRG
jgi:regulator of CtrA degradation